MIALVARIAAALREGGGEVSLDQVLSAHRALALVDAADRDAAYRCLRATMCADRSCWRDFDRAFLEASGGLPERRRSVALDAGSGGEEATVPSPAERARRRAPAAWSRVELLRTRDFASCSAEEIESMRAYVRELARQPPRQPGHRAAPARRGRPDLRGTLARARRRGGEPDRVATVRRRPSPRRLLFAIDLSGSMSEYARPLLIFAAACRRAHPGVEAFVFATRLHRVTRELADPDLDRALAAVAAAAPDRGSGTRIGPALGRLNRDWRSLLGSATTVCVVSDGCDRGEPGELAAESARLARSCGRLLWLNPDAGRRGYEPRVRGILAALPNVTELLAANSLAALEDVAAALAGPGGIGAAR